MGRVYAVCLRQPLHISTSPTHTIWQMPIVEFSIKPSTNKRYPRFHPQPQPSRVIIYPPKIKKIRIKTRDNVAILCVQLVCTALVKTRFLITYCHNHHHPASSSHINVCRVILEWTEKNRDPSTLFVCCHFFCCARKVGIVFHGRMGNIVGYLNPFLMGEPIKRRDSSTRHTCNCYEREINTKKFKLVWNECVFVAWSEWVPLYER